jgi:hypothetical protein
MVGYQGVRIPDAGGASDQVTRRSAVAVNRRLGHLTRPPAETFKPELPTRPSILNVGLSISIYLNPDIKDATLDIEILKIIMMMALDHDIGYDIMIMTIRCRRFKPSTRIWNA